MLKEKQLLRQCEYANILRCDRTSLSKHKKTLAGKAEFCTELEAQSVNTAELLKHVPDRKQQAVTAW